MAQSDEVAHLSSVLGVHLRKVTRTDVFGLLRAALDRMDVVGANERIKAAGYSLDDALCEVDEDGRLLALFIPEKIAIPADALARMQEIRFLLVPETEIDAVQAQAFASLPHLEYLGFRLPEDGADAILREIGRGPSIKAIFCDGGSPDASSLIELQSLTSLLVTGSLRNPEQLARIPSLRHLAILEQGAAFPSLAAITQLETLVVEGASEGPFEFLGDMPNLKALVVDAALPTAVLDRLKTLRTLVMRFDKPSLEPLRSLTELETLGLEKASIRDLAGLHAFSRLARLSIKYAMLDCISGLRGQPSIEFLDVSGASISELPDDLSMPRLRHLEWTVHSGHRLTRASFLQSCANLEILQLSGHALTDLDFIRGLGQLRSISLADNGLSDVRALANLPNLAVLDLSGNNIGSVASLAGNAALTTLVLNRNPVADVQAIGSLNRLEILSLNATGIADLAFVKRLKQLFRLSVSRNRIAQAEPLLELPYIASVDLSGNALTSVPPELCELGSLVSLRLDGNPIKGIDKEIYDKPEGKRTLVLLRDYFRGLSYGRVRNDQVKIILVGNGRVGKTSIVTRLIDDAFDQAQPSTHGIQLRHWSLYGVARDRLQGVPLRVNVWDFGGQDIYHATHRLFMKTRALFLLVWDKDTEEERFSLDESGERYENFRLPYWIDYIKALSGSPVIIVQNKVDTLRDNRPTYGVDLQSVYPPPGGILDYVHVSARRPEHNGMPGLMDSIALAFDGLESVGQELPAKWVEVRDRVTAIDRRYLDFADFVEICESVGLHGTAPESVARFLHEAGTIFYQPPSFGDRMILDQRWAIDAVYALFDRRDAAYTDLKIAGRNGLTLELLKHKVWRQYSNDEHQLLVEFMLSCEMCFEWSKGNYYVPQLLPEERPSRVALRWCTPTDYSMQISYPFLHRAIIDRFLVRTGRLGADIEPEIWKNGVAIFDPGSQSEAIVEAFPNDNRILTQAKGPEAVTLLQAIAREFDMLHVGFPAITAVSADGSQHFVEVGVLKEYARAQSSSVPDLNGQLIDLAPLMIFAANYARGLDTDPARLLSRATTARPEAAIAGDDIFISYAWGDPSETGESREGIVDRLYEVLVAKHFKVVRDKKDNGYRKFISDFMRRIGRGRLVIVVISDKYLRSPYCMYELLEIYEHSQFKNRVMPVVLPDAKLYDLLDRLDYVLYWKQKKDAIAERMTKLGIDAFSSDGAYREYDLYYRRVFNNIDKLTSLLGDWNALTPKLLEENSFATLLNAITEELSKEGSGV